MKKITKKELKRIEKKELIKKDKMWSSEVIARDGFKCVICGDTRIQAHHIIPREVKFLRHDLNNGITLCASHHKFSIKISAHRNPYIFYKTLENIRQTQFKRLLKKYKSEN